MISGIRPGARLRIVNGCSTRRDGQQERHDHVDHEDPAVQHPQHARALTELLEVAALGGEVLQRQRDERAERQQHTHDEREHAVAG
jgi:hypothetical protein